MWELFRSDHLRTGHDMPGDIQLYRATVTSGPAHSMRIRLGAFELDVHAGELHKAGHRIRVQEQPLKVLLALLESPGQVVTREELCRRLWPAHTFLDCDHGLNNAVKRLREMLCDSPLKPRFIETVPRRGYRFVGLFEAPELAEPTPEISILVLPFRNMSGDPAHDYFADGMTETLITSLAQVRAIRVVSRTTTMHYRSSQKSLPEIARELKVDSMVEGSIARSGNQARITAQLIRAADERHLWAAQYQRAFTDIFAVQAEIAHAITRELSVTLGALELSCVRAATRVNSECYDLYLQGRFFWNKRTHEGLTKAVQLFKESIARGPTHAPSHSGLAECSNMLGYWGFRTPAEVFPAARDSAEKALQLDSRLAEAHAARAWPLMTYFRNWSLARRELGLALEANPRCVTAQLWLGHYYTYLGRHESALSCVRRALALEPLSAVVSSNAAFMFFMARQFAAAEEHARRAVELDSSFFPSHFWLGRVYEQQEKFGEAIAQFRQANQLSGAAVCEAGLAHAYAASGDRASALVIAKELRERALREYVSAYWLACVLAGLDQKAEALTYLAAACQEGSPWLVKMRVDPWLDGLRGSDQFSGMLASLGLATRS